MSYDIDTHRKTIVLNSLVVINLMWSINEVNSTLRIFTSVANNIIKVESKSHKWAEEWMDTRKTKTLYDSMHILLRYIDVMNQGSGFNLYIQFPNLVSWLVNTITQKLIIGSPWDFDMTFSIVKLRSSLNYSLVELNLKKIYRVVSKIKWNKFS